MTFDLPVCFIGIYSTKSNLWISPKSGDLWSTYVDFWSTVFAKMHGSAEINAWGRSKVDIIHIYVDLWSTYFLFKKVLTLSTCVDLWSTTHLLLQKYANWGRSKVTIFHQKWWPLIYLVLFCRSKRFWPPKMVIFWHDLAPQNHGATKCSTSIWWLKFMIYMFFSLFSFVFSLRFVLFIWLPSCCPSLCLSLSFFCFSDY